MTRLSSTSQATFGNQRGHPHDPAALDDLQESADGARVKELAVVSPRPTHRPAEPIVLGSRPDPQRPEVVYLGVVFRRKPTDPPAHFNTRAFRLVWPVDGQTWSPLPGGTTEVIETMDVESASGEFLVIARHPFVPAGSTRHANDEPVSQQHVAPRLLVKRSAGDDRRGTGSRNPDTATTAL